MMHNSFSFHNLIQIVTLSCILTINSPLKAEEKMQLTSSDIKEGATLSSRHVYKGFGCEGENISPAHLDKKGLKELGYEVDF